jgi:hypothetical protein
MVTTRAPRAYRMAALHDGPRCQSPTVTVAGSPPRPSATVSTPIPDGKPDILAFPQVSGSPARSTILLMTPHPGLTHIQLILTTRPEDGDRL